MGRARFVDFARGIAVIAMVLWHTADGWLSPVVRVGGPWSLLRFIGGFAAPCFIFLAGTGAALAVRDGPDRGERARRGLLRGLEILLLGYALRLQAWLLDGGALVRPHLARAFLPLLAGYALLFLAIRGALRGEARARRLAMVGLLAVACGLAQVPWVAPGRLLRLLQVDVLQAIGASLVLLALGERHVRLFQRPRLAAMLGLIVALATHVVAQPLPGPLPVPLAAYLGRFEPGPGQPTPALFPLFPWLAYACFGAAFGSYLRRSVDTDWTVTRAGIFGALLALATSEAYPTTQALFAEASWTVQPVRVLFRLGLVLSLLLVGSSWAGRTRGRLVARLGRASLRVYWAHLMVAYGALGAPFHKRLSMPAWASLVVGLLALMYLLARVRLPERVPREPGPST